jgi:hypothetical protein
MLNLEELSEDELTELEAEFRRLRVAAAQEGKRPSRQRDSH